MRKFLLFGYAILIFLGLTASLQATTYYLSPSGLDGNPGTAAQPWATFGRAWQSLVPGDTLILQDGVYYTNIEPPFGGRSGQPITIKAANDGKAVIDGEGLRVPILLWNYRNAHFFDIEGLVVRNGPHSPSPQAVVDIETDDNILRRVSAYNADPDDNSMVILLSLPSERNLVEDCVAAGTGRKMINLFEGTHNVIRRCFAYWLGWDGRKSCQDWPQVSNINIYNGSYDTVENCVAVGPVAESSIMVQANAPGVQAVGNKVLGSIAINAGVNPDGTLVEWPLTRPQPTTCDPHMVYDYINWYDHRVGFKLYGHAQAILQDNVFRDVFAWHNASHGFSITPSATFTGNALDRGTITGNGLGLVLGGGAGTDAVYTELQKISVTNSIISVVRDTAGKTYSPITGGGARLQNRYINGVLMDGTNGQPAQALWPWPMEDRIRAEMGISVTNMIAQVVPGQVTAVGPVTQPRLEASVIMASNFSATTPQTITLSNKSSSSLTVQAYVFQKIGSSPYTVIGGTCPGLPFSLAASQSCTVQVGLKPGTTGIAEDYLSFYSPQSPPYPFAPRVFLSNAGTLIVNPGSTPPPAGTIPLPGKLEAEAYGNSGGVFSKKSTTDLGGGLKIADIHAGSWLEYSVNVSQSGTYAVSARVASASTITKSLSLYVDGVKVDTLTPVVTNGWDTFVDVFGAPVNLTQGNHTLRITLDTGGYDLNYLTFGAAGTPPAVPQNLHLQGIQ
jgi:hypothetical protein